ncbi:MAG: response regulator transcription factor [Lachnospiraceae bacterium]|nr:response regulator transcription factor [Lachnospiraceae bacterium]
MEANKPTILVIEDEIGIQNFVSHILNSNGYHVVCAATGKEARIAYLSSCPDLILLDLGLPDLDGMVLIHEFKGWSPAPIIVVSARESEAEKVAALNAGADDYICKPFGISEFAARVHATLRSRGVLSPKGGEEQIMQTKDLVLDLDSYMVLKDGKEIHFTQKEFKCLALLMKNAGKVLTYDFILRNVWGPYSGTDNQILRVHMANIRKKLEEDPVKPKYIYTELGIGYRMLTD